MEKNCFRWFLGWVKGNGMFIVFVIFTDFCIFRKGWGWCLGGAVGV